MSSWPTIPLSKTTSFIVDNRGRTAPTVELGIPLIATNCIDSHDLYPSYKNIRYFSKETYETWFRSHPRPNDIILTLKGSQNGAACLVPDPVDFAIAQDMVALRVDETVMHFSFLLAALRSDDVQSEIKNLDVSGVIPHLKKSDFDKLQIPCPPLQDQRAIGRTYLDFCRKIDLLHRQNKTLEALAETLFRQWFVEEAGDDWYVGRLGDLIELHYGKSLKDSERSGFGFPVVGSSGIVGFHSEALVCGPGIVIGRKGTIGKVIYLFDDFFPIDTTYFVKSKTSPGGLLHFEHFLLRTIEFGNSDSAVPGLNRDIALSSDLRIPPSAIIARFNEWFTPFSDKLRENAAQIRTLEKLRDTLLPKLMSGEVRVRHE